jgi:hypothetical protein
MTDTRHNTVVGVFDSQEPVVHAVDELRRTGFRGDQIGVLGRGELEGAVVHERTGNRTEEGALAGAVAGGTVGGLWALGIAAGVFPALGPVFAGGVLAAVLASAVGGAAVAGVVGALLGMGFSEDEARYYQGEFEAGKVLVMVQAEDRPEAAAAVLRRFGAQVKMPEHATVTPNGP